jgi:LmbE family N-acetylglucosaminyl deacetylase
MSQKLVIAAHVDDEVLGCASVLDEDTIVWFCGIREDYTNPDGEHRVTTAQRYLEAEAVAMLMGHMTICDMTAQVNSYELLHTKDEIEYVINTNRPEYVFVCAPGFNQDHKTVYEATVIATRPHDTNWFCKKVLAYESIQEVGWPNPPLEVNYYVPLDIDRKLEAYQLHASQVRGHRSPEAIRSLAAVRGAAVNMPYAEAFKILRWVD